VEKLLRVQWGRGGGESKKSLPVLTEKIQKANKSWRKLISKGTEAKRRAVVLVGSQG